jgi:hypothetical protein
MSLLYAHRPALTNAVEGCYATVLLIYRLLIEADASRTRRRSIGPAERAIADIVLTLEDLDLLFPGAKSGTNQ